jgi:hypothetical protein
MTEDDRMTETAEKKILLLQRQARLIFSAQTFERSAGLDSVGALKIASAIIGAGFIIVPIAPTDAMVNAAPFDEHWDEYDAARLWSAMVDEAIK